jgi:uncharacterized membrane protein
MATRIPHNVGVRRGIAWLHGELPSLVDQGVLTADAAEALRRHYGPPDRVGVAGRLGQILLASIGALLVGGGIILILAHNWEELGRPARAALALGTLVAAQGLAIYAALRRASSTAWIESTSALLVAAIGAAIALVGQTYNVGGSFEDLMFGWLWLALPIPYLTGSTLAAVGVWALLVVRAGGQMWLGPRPDIWAVMIAAAPFVIIRARRYPESWATALLTLAAAVSTFVVGTILTVDHGWDGMWAVFDVSFLSALVALVSWPVGSEGIGWRRRLAHPAWFSLIVLAAILSFDDVWRGVDDVGVEWQRVTFIVVPIIVFGCVALSTAVAVVLVQSGRLAAAVGAAAGLVVVIGHVLAQSGVDEAGWMLFNLWLLGAGIAILAEGVRVMELGTVNRGLAAVAAFMVARFFDTELSFLLRGVGFVTLGLVCLAVNLWLIRGVRRVAA